MSILEAYLNEIIWVKMAQILFMALAWPVNSIWQYLKGSPLEQVASLVALVRGPSELIERYPIAHCTRNLVLSMATEAISQLIRR